jgi:hypothetical protein
VGEHPEVTTMNPAAVAKVEALLFNLVEQVENDDRIM